MPCAGGAAGGTAHAPQGGRVGQGGQCYQERTVTAGGEGGRQARAARPGPRPEAVRSAVKRSSRRRRRAPCTGVTVRRGVRVPRVADVDLGTSSVWHQLVDWPGTDSAVRPPRGAAMGSPSQPAGMLCFSVRGLNNCWPEERRVSKPGNGACCKTKAGGHCPLAQWMYCTVCTVPNILLRRNFFGCRLAGHAWQQRAERWREIMAASGGGVQKYR